MLTILLLLNATWFAAGFIAFSLKSTGFVKHLVAKENRGEKTLQQLRTALHFLGGFNLALCLLCLALVVSADLFPDVRQWRLIFAFLSLAHGTQFICNLPVAIRESRQQPHSWSVLTGPMLFIFIIDAVLMIADAIAVAVL